MWPAPCAVKFPVPCAPSQKRYAAAIGPTTQVSRVRLSTAPAFAVFLISPYVPNENASTSATHGGRP